MATIALLGSDVEAGIGQIGAGITTAPMPCFTGAVAALAATLPTGKDGAS